MGQPGHLRGDFEERLRRKCGDVCIRKRFPGLACTAGRLSIACMPGRRRYGFTMRTWIGAFLLAFVAMWGVANAQTELRDGDIIFQTSRSRQSLAIQRATGSRYSHMGLVLHRRGKPFVFEASSTVRYTPLHTWIRRGTNGHYVVKRLRDADERLTPASLAQMRAAARAYQGKSYDAAFRWSDKKMYCSELVWKIYRQALGIEVGELRPLGAFRLDDPVVRTKVRERYGRNVPLDEPVISPSAMYEWAGLKRVVQR